MSDSVRLQQVDEPLRQRHHVLDVAKQRLHVLGRQRPGLRQRSGEERLQAEIQTRAVVRLGRVQFRDDVLAGFTLLLRQLFLTHRRRLDWRRIVRFKQTKRIFTVYFDVNHLLAGDAS